MPTVGVKPVWTTLGVKFPTPVYGVASVGANVVGIAAGATVGTLVGANVTGIDVVDVAVVVAVVVANVTGMAVGANVGTPVGANVAGIVVDVNSAIVKTAPLKLHTALHQTAFLRIRTKVTHPGSTRHQGHVHAVRRIICA